MRLLRVNVTALVSFLIVTFCQVPAAPTNALYSIIYNRTNNIRTFNRMESKKNENRVSSSRVVGGNYASTGDFPWMALVINYGGGITCGGSIVSSRWILTAAHCLLRGRQFLVVMGTVDRASAYGQSYYDRSLSMRTNVAVIHPRYWNQYNDIGLLLMPRNIPFNHVIQPVYLAGLYEAQQLRANNMGLVLGWGDVTNNHDGGSRILKYGWSKLIDNAECRRWEPRITDGQFCTSPGTSSNACHGDSGGPLVIHNDNKYVQVGIVSSGQDRCPWSWPVVFTRVSSYEGWIRQVTGSYIHNNYYRTVQDPYYFLHVQ